MAEQPGVASRDEHVAVEGRRLLRPVGGVRVDRQAGRQVDGRDLRTGQGARRSAVVVGRVHLLREPAAVPVQAPKITATTARMTVMMRPQRVASSRWTHPRTSAPSGLAAVRWAVESGSGRSAAAGRSAAVAGPAVAGPAVAGPAVAGAAAGWSAAGWSAAVAPPGSVAPRPAGRWRVCGFGRRCRRRRPRLRQRHRRARAGGGRPCRSGGTPQRVALRRCNNRFLLCGDRRLRDRFLGRCLGRFRGGLVDRLALRLRRRGVGGQRLLRPLVFPLDGGSWSRQRGDRRLGHDVVEDAPVGGAEEEHRGGPLRRILGDEGLAGAGGGLVDGEPVGERAVELGGEGRGGAVADGELHRDDRGAVLLDQALRHPAERVGGVDASGLAR